MKKRANLMFACTVGTTLEWYDFFAFAACAVLVFDKQFFVVGNPLAATLLALATFAVGFVARPLGGIVFGMIGDRIGRRKTLVVSLLMMGISTFCVGLLPTYASIGIAAPLLLVLLRIVQGIAVGGEATGAILMIAESMPGAQRGFWTSFTMFAGPLANVLTAFVIGMVQRSYGDAAFVDWAWRIPFFISALLVIVGFWTRRRVEESAAFAELAAAHQTVERASLRETCAGNGRQMARAFFVKAAENTFLYLFSTFALGLATGYLHFSRPQALSALMWASAIEVVVILVAAHVSDRIGRRPVLIAGLLGAAIAGCSLFTLSPGSDYVHLQLALIACLTCHGIILGPMAAYMAELFPTRVRFTALSTSYQLASVLGGSIAPIVGTLLVSYTGSAIFVAGYAILMALPAFVAVIASRESRGEDFQSRSMSTGHAVVLTNDRPRSTHA
ncbi:MFS transporter [Burkholderia cenocepacia]|uniref:MFS transporter n=1 Tax=Burkholderia cenocepacia TaxID=95486 RepID=UPI001588FBA0|nr:MFS transporter [Burkholderia cenocepacia]